MLRTPAGFLIAAIASLLAVFGLVAGMLVSPESGAHLDPGQTVVLEVDTGSPAWRNGLRAGDVVREVTASTPLGGWRLIVRRGELEFGTSEAGMVNALRNTVPFAIVGLAAVLLAIALLLRGEALAIGLLPIGLGLATWPLIRTGNPAHALLAGPAAFLLAGVAVVLASRTRTRVALGLGAALVYVGLWLAAWSGAPAAFGMVDLARLPALAVLGAWAAWPAVDRDRIRAWLASPDGPSPFDLAYLPVIVVLLVAAYLFLQAEGLPLLVLGGVAVIAYPFTRRAARSVVERALLGRMRRDAQLRAVEDERGRLAREIHDAPLQELAAVIRRLDTDPAAHREADELRQVAAELRGVAHALRPPVLEDLGLAAAIEDLAGTLAARHPGWSIRVDVDDLAGRGSRPDAEVELAAFRIVQEAAGNALRHSHGRTLQVLGTIGRGAIDLAVSDDGAGLTEHVIAAARRRGHFGIDGMRDRARAVGGRLDVRSSAAGTTVAFAWEAGA
jgi:signal transduction histidine kinase